MKLIRLLQIVLWKLHSRILCRNNSLQNIHKGEKCYIIGNGASLKYIDYEALPKFKAIGTTYLLLDERIKFIDLKYYVIPDTYTYYKLCYTPRLKKITKNYREIFFKRFIKNNKNINFFTHLSNFYAFFKNPNNVNFYYDKEFTILKNKKKLNTFNLTHSLHSPLNGSLDIMITVAKFLGFREVILLGCDYLSDPPLQGHFYSNTDPFIENAINEEYENRIREVSHGLDVTIILPKDSKSNIFKYKSIEEFIGKQSRCKKNSEFINRKDIDLLEIASTNKQLYM